MRQFVDLLKVLLIPIYLGIGYVSVRAQPSTSVTPPSKATDPFFLTRAKNLARQAAERQNGGLNFYRAEVTMYGPAIDSPHRQNSDGSVTFTFKGGAPGFVTPTVETIATVTPQGFVSLQYNGPLRSVAAAKVKPTPPQTQWPIQPPQTLPIVLEKPVPIPSPARSQPSPPQPVAPQPILPKVASPLPPNIPSLPALQTSPNPPLSRIPVSPQLQTPAVVSPSIPNNSPARTLPPSTQNNGILADLFLARAKNLARQAAVNANGGLAQYRPEPSMFGPAAGTPHRKNQDGSITFRFQGGIPGYRTPTVESVVTVTKNSTVTVTYNGPIRP